MPAAVPGNGCAVFANSMLKAVDGCRSELASADVEQADEKEDDFVKGFKVANFEIIDSPDKGIRPHPYL